MTDNRGVTILEALISAAALSIVAFAIGQQFVSQKTFSTRQRNLDAEAMMVQSLMDQVRSRIEIYPKLFAAFNIDEYPENLSALVTQLESNGGSGWPLAWSQDFFGKVDQCQHCPGRAIYIIQQQKVCSNPLSCNSDPVGDRTAYYMGLYRVRLVLFNKSLFTTPPHAHEYFFTVGSK